MRSGVNISPLHGSRSILIAAVILVACTLVQWVQRGFVPALHAYTPLDGSPVASANGWFVLTYVRPYVPPDAKVVVLGSSPGENQELYMMAFAILDQCVPRPISYFGFPHPEYLTDASHLITFRRGPPPGQGWREVLRLSDGALYER